MRHKISVIIPVYNVEKYLDKCIESVLQQTIDNLQIILVNDGSTDNSKEICEKWIKENNRIELINKENEGLGQARNEGLKVANGEYIFFLDSDDYLPKDALETFYKTAVSNNADVVCGISISVLKNGEEKKNDKIMNTKEFIGTGKQVIRETKYKDIPPMVWLYFYKREFLDKYKLRFQKGLYHEDCEFTIRVYYYANKMAFVNQVTYCQFISDNSIIRSKNIKKSIDAIKIAQNIEKFINDSVKEEDIQKLFRKYVAYLYSYSLHYAIEIGEDLEKVFEQEKKEEIIKKLNTCVKYKPLALALKYSKVELYGKIYKKSAKKGK